MSRPMVIKKLSMTIGDYAPSASPSVDQQRDALRKGLGRAVPWAMQGKLADEPLLAACLQDQRFDRSVDECRGPWLWQLVQIAGAIGRFRTPLLHGLYALSDEDGADQLCALAFEYAKTGDQTFRDRLYEIVERKPFADSAWLGEREIVALDGEPAFLFAASARGRLLPVRAWEWGDGALIGNATERIGEERVTQLLERSADDAVHRFLTAWRRDQEEEAGHVTEPPYEERMRAISPSEIISAAETSTSNLGLFRGWGMRADPADLAAVMHRLWAAKEPAVIGNFLRVFSNRALPEFDDRLIGLCSHDDNDVRQRAFRALEANTHPAIRAFALARLAAGDGSHEAVALLQKNFEPGDEQHILDALTQPADEDDLHWLLMNVRKVLEQNPIADASRLGVIAYALNPCGACRFHAANVMRDRGALPDWAREECRHDADERCRKLFEQGAEQPPDSSS